MKRNDDLESITTFVVSVGVLIGFLAIIFGILYMLIFVSQPMQQAPNDAKLIELLNTLSIFLTGALSSVLGMKGLKKMTQTRKKAEPSEKEN